jgi:membrane carboxypeptidase/penicillin-binding protein
LQGVITSGTATSAAIGRPAAGKTGTTQDNRDAWFAGYVPQVSTVVWMGYPIEEGPDKKLGTADDYSPLMSYCYEAEKCRPVDGIEVTGGSFPASIWRTFMATVLAEVPIESFIPPAYEGSTVLNEAPPPPPTYYEEPEEEKEEKKEDNGPPEDGGGGNGNGGGNDGGGDGGGD